MSRFTIGKLAAAAGVGVETVRFYERKGLLARPPARSTRFREYPPEAVPRIRFVKRAQTLGFTLAEIGELIALTAVDAGDRSDVKLMAKRKLDAIRTRIADLQRLESTLQELVTTCSGHGPIEGCPIIEAMTDDHVGHNERRTNEEHRERR